MPHEQNRPRTIALIAHDHRKQELREWVQHNRDTLCQHDLIATGTTGRLLEEALDVPVARLLSGPLGGDQQIGALIATGQVDLLIFFWDPLNPQPHDPDVRALLRLATVWNTPTACNRATADYLISSVLFSSDYETARPDFTDYVNRPLEHAPE